MTRITSSLLQSWQCATGHPPLFSFLSTSLNVSSGAYPYPTSSTSTPVEWPQFLSLLRTWRNSFANTSILDHRLIIYRFNLLGLNAAIKQHRCPRLRNVGLRMIVPTSELFNVRLYIDTRRSRLYVPRAGSHLWEMFASPTYLASSAGDQPATLTSARQRLRKRATEAFLVITFGIRNNRSKWHCAQLIPLKHQQGVIWR